MNENEIIILNKLKKHSGAVSAITYKNLAFLTGINEREVRLCVANLVTEYQCPIATTSDAGYYWLSNDEEYLHASNELMSRIRKLSKRHKGLRIGYGKSKQTVKPLQEVLF